ncbi:PASTA domain-containing protein [Rosettibacter firmus]|uniref:PASTA domain-containing protein n=1 Tax=Rosettibacter firmus TaxID=3111522 RepID=UPI00336BF0AA
MRIISKNTLFKLSLYGLSFIVTIIIINSIIMPYYVSGDELKVPNVIGMHKDKAIELLRDLNLNPIITTSRYDEKYDKDYVIFQKPLPNTYVKENRKIYLTISGGLQTVKMPFLINKSVRDAQITLQKLGLVIDSLENIVSDFPPNTIAEQQYPEGMELPVGTKVRLKVSIGPQIGKIKAPNLIGKSLIEAEKILKNYSLKIGLKTYIYSKSLLPNTIVDQQPSENTLLNVGDSINVVVTLNK